MGRGPGSGGCKGPGPLDLSGFFGIIDFLHKNFLVCRGTGTPLLFEKRRLWVCDVRSAPGGCRFPPEWGNKANEFRTLGKSVQEHRSGREIDRPFEIKSMEGLILAQDERWRRA